jgi:hypothetical protein
MPERPAPGRALTVAIAAVLIGGCSAPLASAWPPETSSSQSFAALASAEASELPTIEPTTSASSTPTPIGTPEPPPTDEPKPTPDDVFPPRTEVEINDNVVDRAGVPRALRDGYWWTFRGADVGLLGTTAQLGIPSEEEILDARDGLVVSRRPTPDSPGGSEILVRDFETGATVRRIRTDMGWLDAQLVGRRLFWAGLARGPGCPDPGVDGGVGAVDLDGGDPVVIVDPGRVVGGCFAGRQILVSPSGETVGAVMSVIGDGNSIDVIDVSTLAHYRLRDVWPDAITDDTFMQWDHPPTDGIAPGSGMSAYDLRDGSLRWRFSEGADARKEFTPSRFLAYGSRFYVEYTMNSNSGYDMVIATFDQHTGERRELVRQVDMHSDDVLRMQEDSSRASFLTLEAFVYSERPRPRSVAIVDVETGQVTWDAFTIDPPWLCYPDRCIRDE